VGLFDLVLCVCLVQVVRTCSHCDLRLFLCDPTIDFVIHLIYGNPNPYFISTQLTVLLIVCSAVAKTPASFNMNNVQTHFFWDWVDHGAGSCNQEVCLLIDTPS